MKSTVIYHSADFDGIFCREIAQKFLIEPTLIGWNYGQPKVAVEPNQLIYVLDLGLECLDNPVDDPNIIWIDHHKTNIDKYPTTIRGHRIDGVAACRLFWAWCNNKTTIMPIKEQFINRLIYNENEAVRLAGEYDVWDKRDKDAEILQYGLRTLEPDWTKLLSLNVVESVDELQRLLNVGTYSQMYAKKCDANLVTSKSWLMQWEGLVFLCINTGIFNSLTFEALDVEGAIHDALLGFTYNGKYWTVSLYHSKYKKENDLSIIAKKYGGGGHKGACGFTCKQLPF
jgi:oligoribonuclease NrnB/cAMP/cGMP phosphodiesterase (DHH superfamily)